jgi:hypothetical protein
LDSRCGSALAVPRVVRRQPRQRDSNRHKKADGYKKSGEIVDCKTRRGDQYAVSDHAYHGRSNLVEPSELMHVREPRYDKVADRPEHIAWYRQRLCLRSCPFPET